MAPALASGFVPPELDLVGSTPGVVIRVLASAGGQATDWLITLTSVKGGTVPAKSKASQKTAPERARDGQLARMQE